MKNETIKVGSIHIADESCHANTKFQLVRVAGWLPDKLTLIFQMVEPYEKIVSVFGTKYGFKKKGYYFYPFKIEDFKEQFRPATHDDVAMRIKI